jgi:hypothetical protein
MAGTSIAGQLRPSHSEISRAADPGSLPQGRELLRPFSGFAPLLVIEVLDQLFAIGEPLPAVLAPELRPGRYRPLRLLLLRSEDSVGIHSAGSMRWFSVMLRALPENTPFPPFSTCVENGGV